MRRNFKEIAASIIHPKYRHIRRKVTAALENAYQTGLDDAAAHLEATAREIREIRRHKSPAAQPLTDFSGYANQPPPNAH